MSDVNENIQVEHLISLVGGNPLPVAVSAELLLRPGGTLTLLHSPDSISVAERLEAVLRKREHFKDKHFECSELDESSPDSIRRTMSEVLKKISAVSKGLDYTGGTKAMAAHAYAEFALHKNKENAVSSYLDPRSHSLRLEIFKDGGRTSQQLFLGNKVKISIEEMLKLHGWWNQKTKSRKDAILPNIATKLTQIMGDSESATAWREWIITEVKKEKQTPEEKRAAGASTIKLVSTNENVMDVLDSLKAELGVTSTEISSVQEKVGKADKFSKWLCGEWLDNAVCSCLHELKEFEFNEVIFDLNTCGEPQFQLDVAAIRGHQTFFVSCTTDDKKDLTKTKLIEIRLRAKQLGGDEAAYCLVCCYKNPVALEAELRKDLDDRKVHVIGVDGLADLQERLRQWIEKEIKR